MVATSKPPRNKTRVRISKSGQITLPARIRKQLGVNVGEQVDIVEEHDGTFSVQPVHILSVEEIAGKFGRAIKPEELRDALHEARESGAVRQRYKNGSIINDLD